MEFIDLDLKKIDEDNEVYYTIQKIAEMHEISVLLGSPGSGKTSLLKKYESENNDSQFIKVKKLLKLNTAIKPETKVVLLDGIDEYRSISDDKAFVITKLGDKINSFPKDVRVVLSCREMDWYGETDEIALKEEIDRKANLFNICPMNEIQKHNLAEILQINEPDQFIQKFSGYGFLDNPQMFYMLSKIYMDQPNKIIKSKTELFKTFISNCREKNPDNILNKINEIDEEEFLKYSGYIAFYYIFSDVDKLDNHFVDLVSDSENKYYREKIEIALKSSLFFNNDFIHRTLAEYCLAYFINKYKLNNKQFIQIERIKSLFTIKGRIPTELRGHSHGYVH